LCARDHVRLAAKQPADRARAILAAAAPVRVPAALRPGSTRARVVPIGPALELRAGVALEQLSQPVAELAAVIFAHGLVADCRRYLAEARLETEAKKELAQKGVIPTIQYKQIELTAEDAIRFCNDLYLSLRATTAQGGAGPFSIG